MAYNIGEGFKFPESSGIIKVHDLKKISSSLASRNVDLSGENLKDQLDSLQESTGMTGIDRQILMQDIQKVGAEEVASLFDAMKSRQASIADQRLRPGSRQYRSA